MLNKASNLNHSYANAARSRYYLSLFLDKTVLQWRDPVYIILHAIAMISDINPTRISESAKSRNQNRTEQKQIRQANKWD